MPVKPGKSPAHSGFTLVELVVVIMLLGILAAAALPRLVALQEPAEKAAIQAWVGALRSAYTLAFSNQLVGGGGYTAPYQMSLWNLVRCDAVDDIPGRQSSSQWQGHYLALGSLRDPVFKDPAENACVGNTISFTSKTNRVITITNAGVATGVTWSAVPAY